LVHHQLDLDVEASAITDFGFAGQYTATTSLTAF